MKLLRLAGAAFGPYRDGFEIDFTSFDADGVYLIAGPTGAGKSTILDAVTFALYGSAPRYEGKPHLRSDLAGPEQPTWVELEFAVGDRVLRVHRSPEYERPKQRGSGTTKEKAAAQLLELVEGGWQSVSSSIGEVGTEISRTLGLTKDEFLQVILLAQGGFAEFLAASSDERKQLLQRLFGTGSMRRLRELLLADAKAVDAAREGLERIRDDRGARVLAVLESLPDVDGQHGDGQQSDDQHGDDQQSEVAAPAAATIDEALLTAAESRLAEHIALADEAEQTASATARDARSERDAARELASRYARRSNATAALATLDEAASGIAADRLVLADADRAAEVAGALDRWSRADDGAARTETALARAAAKLPEGIGASRAEVEPAHADAVDAGARAAAAVRLEAGVPALERAAGDATTAATETDAAVDAAKHERSAAPAAREAIASARESAATLAAGLPGAESAVATARGKLDARRDAGRLAGPLAVARTAAADTANAQAAAAAEAQRMQSARIAGIAGELASGLVDGEACPVCGSPDHPAQHPPADDAITADDVADALSASEQAVSAAREANDALTELERRRAALDAVAGSIDLASLQAELATAKAARVRSTAAEAERARRTAELAEHDGTSRGLDERIVELEQHAAQARSASAGATTRLTDTRARLTQDLAGHESTAALQSATTARITALRAWLDADAAHTRALDEQEVAADAAATAFAEHELRDRDATSAMRLEPSARSALRQRIRTHDDAVASTKGVLAQPDLAGLEGTAPELAPLEERLERAEAVGSTAAKAATAASTTRDHAVADIRAARDAIRPLAEGADHAEVVRSLASALHGDNELRQDIETYVLATRLGAIIEAANLRLAAMTDGRFALLHDESTAYRRKASGLGIEVLDAHTGVPRTAASLSGGETFLASLSLALGLADVVQAESGGVSLETLFVDEGFGSLDQDTLEAAMATLDELRVGGRSVGVISHVQQMQERIPTAIRVVPLPGGGSRIVVTPSDVAPTA